MPHEEPKTEKIKMATSSLENGINRQGSGSYALLCETPRKCVQLCEEIKEDQVLTVPCSRKRDEPHLGKNHRGKDALYKVGRSLGERIQ